jgi:hypothetical protein
MRKLKLSLDELQVDSFHATAPEARGGTVEANSWTQYADESCFGTCDGGCTQWGSCNGGCGSGGASCNGTCIQSCNGSCGCSANMTECGCQTWETCPNATVCS